MPFYLAAGYRRKSLSGARKQQLQVVVNLRGGSDGGAGVTGIDFLFNGDGRGNALDVIDVGLVHAPDKLPCVGAQAFYVASLSFGVERIKGQRRLSRSRQPGDDD